MARAKAGDLVAEEFLYRRHVRYIAGFVTRLIGSCDDADDCIQETFVIALESLGSVREGDAIRGWLSQIAINLVRRRFRRNKLRRLFGLERSSPGADFPWTGASPEIHAELSEIWRVVETLSSEERIAWSLRFVEGYALEEVAELCRCSLATVKRRVASVSARIRAHTRVDIEVLR